MMQQVSKHSNPSHERRFLVVVTLGAVSILWLAFAWLMLIWIGFFLQSNSLSDLSIAEATVIASTFFVAPLLLVLAWSVALQGHPPTTRQWRIIITVIGVALLLFAVIAAIAVGIGFLKDSTPL